ncbi:MAG: hypothetical protein P8N60_02005 [Burkholderiaceae bacterium]|nr:hypothetical protein [Burkholderiaceae bacterium]
MVNCFSNASIAARSALNKCLFETHGDTSSTPPPYTMAGLADDALQLLQALGVHRTHWVGQAMAGLDLNQRI